MKRLATTMCVVAGLLVATSAMAINLQRAPQSASTRANRPMDAAATLGCDDGVTWGGWYEGADDRLGNTFNFGSGSTLSRVTFTHYDYSTVGPYDYDLEVWDPSSCTFASRKAGLVAANSVYTNTTEIVDTCPDALYLSGSMLVAVHPKTCNTPTDCYPDLVYDNQLNVACPVIINNASTAPVCYDVSSYAGPFLLRVDINDCPTPVHRGTWGQLKSVYR